MVMQRNNKIMESKQDTIGDIIESEKQMVLHGPNATAIILLMPLNSVTYLIVLLNQSMARLNLYLLRFFFKLGNILPLLYFLR